MTIQVGAEVVAKLAQQMCARQHANPIGKGVCASQRNTLSCWRRVGADVAQIRGLKALI